MSRATTALAFSTSAPARAAKPTNGRIHLVGIGALAVASPPDKLRTVLGSCIGIVILDPQGQVAGLAHSILPEGDEEKEELGKYADQAVDNLVVKLTSEGGHKGRMRAKLVGGAAMFGIDSGSHLGDRNVEAAQQRLQVHGIPIVAQAVGGTKGRKLLLDPSSGEVEVSIIGAEPEII